MRGIVRSTLPDKLQTLCCKFRDKFVVRVIRECLPSIPAYAKSATGAVDKSELAEETVGLLDFLSKRPRGTKEIENEHQQDMMLCAHTTP